MRAIVRAELENIAGRFSNESPKADELEAKLTKRYPAFEAWPADAQLGLLLLGWALGPGFSLPGFKDSVDTLEPDFFHAAALIAPAGDVGDGLKAIARQCFRNADLVLRWQLVDSVLYYPIDLSSCIGACWECCPPVTETATL